MKGDTGLAAHIGRETRICLHPFQLVQSGPLADQAVAAGKDQPAQPGDKCRGLSMFLTFEIGVSQRTVQLERDLWILVQSISPEEADILINDKRDMIDDPEFRSIYLAYDAAFDLSPDDPRLPALADLTKRWFANQSGRSKRSERPDIIFIKVFGFRRYSR